MATAIGDLPDEILSKILSSISSTRTRNAAALVSHKWRRLERLTRTSLVLRGNVRHLHLLPSCFPSVSHLDLSLLSPFGHPLHRSPYLSLAFPAVTDLSLYLRHHNLLLHLLNSHWPNITRVKLIRFHQRPSSERGSELADLFASCPSLLSLDLSSFYCWTDDIVPALESFRERLLNLVELNLMNPSFSEGFRSDQIKAIASLCPNLNLLKVPCMFDDRYLGYVDDETLITVSSNCPRLKTLHLVDMSALTTTRDFPADTEDAAIGAVSLIDMFSNLPLLEELVLDVCSNVSDSKLILEQLNSKCPKLRTLKLGHFHGLCIANDPNFGSKLDGIAMCQRLESLSIRNSNDLTDSGLVAIAKGCVRLTRFEIEGCDRITVKYMRLFTSLLRKTLIDVRISNCKNFGAVSSLTALEPIQDRIVRLHIDCVWDSVEHNVDLNEDNSLNGTDSAEMGRTEKKSRFSYIENRDGHYERTWDKLQHLSLWVSVGELLTPLVNAGLENCPNLEEIEINIEGDTRDLSRPSQEAFGLSSLERYPMLKKMCLDCKDTIGYMHTAPSGHTDLSEWERFYLNGIGSLTNLSELDYWPPQDRDVNQRSLSSPAVGLLGECTMLRKLFIHGTAHEHFMTCLLRIPNENLRDVQLRADYYPAPENDMSTEMRVNSCIRFEHALNNRLILD